ncbi:MAG TPA: STAS domain-containing protein [Solirubrobacteraceae bacterium]|jgi:anti-sigma B factor antagonist|nr:STAS domain-containing protein [Solirubrobacteraceae bacterium]
MTLAGLTVTSRSEGATEHLRVRGQIDIATVDALADEIGEALAREPQTVVVDLSAVGFIGSGGLRALLEADVRARAGGCRLVVVPGTGVVRRLLDRTNADRTLTLAP